MALFVLDSFVEGLFTSSCRKKMAKSLNVKRSTTTKSNVQYFLKENIVLQSSICQPDHQTKSKKLSSILHYPIITLNTCLTQFSTHSIKPIKIKHFSSTIGIINMCGSIQLFPLFIHTHHHICLTIGNVCRSLRSLFLPTITKIKSPFAFALPLLLHQ